MNWPLMVGTFAFAFPPTVGTWGSAEPGAVISRQLFSFGVYASAGSLAKTGEE